MERRESCYKSPFPNATGIYMGTLKSKLKRGLKEVKTIYKEDGRCSGGSRGSSEWTAKSGVEHLQGWGHGRGVWKLVPVRCSLRKKCLIEGRVVAFLLEHTISAGSWVGASDVRSRRDADEGVSDFIHHHQSYNSSSLLK